jgi:adenylate cyclase
MAVEIERKFLVKDMSWQAGVVGRVLLQGYICTQAHTTVRARVSSDQAWLTIKGPTKGCSRAEFEFEIPVAQASSLLEELAQDRLVRKTRYRINQGAHVWEVDVFAGKNAPLILAEIELGSESEAFEIPSWAGLEVSDDPRYYNSYLAEHPYSAWMHD